MSGAIPRLFADVSTLLEDLHGLAVEGLASDQPADIRRVLVRDLRCGIAQLDSLTIALALRLGRMEP